MPGGERSIAATCLGSAWRHTVLDDQVRALLAERVDVVDVDPATLAPLSPAAVEPVEADILITGWGTPSLDASVLDAFPGLRLIVHAAGSVRDLVTPEVWRRGIQVSTAADANAPSVADFTVSQIHLSVKNAWHLAARTRQSAAVAPRAAVRGIDGAVIGLVGMGRIGALVAERLARLDVTVIAYDPHLGDQRRSALGIRMTSLQEVFSVSDVVSLHAPLTPSTEHMVSRELLSSMRPHATFINTARGALVDNDALADVLARREDLFALLDVTEPEPLPDGHPLLSLPNTFLTPHIAGSLGTEEARLGALAAAEIRRFVLGQPLVHAVDEDRLALSA